MKVFKPSFLFLLAAGLLAGVAYWDYQNIEKENNKKTLEQKVFKVEDNSSVTEVFVEREAGQLRIKKEDKQWRVVEPVTDTADVNNVDSFISSITNEKAEVLEGENHNWADYGLEPEWAKVTIKQGDKTETFVISQKNSFDNKKYLRKVGSNSLYLGGDSWTNILEKKANDLRNKKLFPENKSPAEIVISGENKLHFYRQDKHWLAKGFEKLKLSDSEVDKLFDTISSLETIDFVSETKPKEMLSKYKLSGSVNTIKVVFSPEKEGATKEEWNLSYSSESEGAHFAVLNSREIIYKIAKNSFDKIRWPISEFRDRKGPFHFDDKKVHQIQYKTDLTQLNLKKTGTKWALENPVPEKELDPEKVTQLLVELSALRAADYTGQLNHKSIESRKKNIQLRDEAGQVVFDFVWGEEYKHKINANSLYYAKTNLTDEVIGVDVGPINAMPGQTLLRDISKPDLPIETKTIGTEKVK